MKVLLALIVSLALELWAFSIYRNSPLSKPAHFHTIVLLIQLVMCWSGLEGARWFLRRSQFNQQSRVDSDLTRLWIWMGLPSGLVCSVTCLLAMWLQGLSNSVVVGPLVLAHSAGGALTWLSGCYWALPKCISSKELSIQEKILVALGFLSHAIAGAVYWYIYPGATIPLAALFLSLIPFFFILFHIALCSSFYYIYSVVAPSRTSNN
jgi:hypothetical protein